MAGKYIDEDLEDFRSINLPHFVFENIKARLKYPIKANYGRIIASQFPLSYGLRFHSVVANGHQGG